MTRTDFKNKITAMIRRQAPNAQIVWASIKADKKTDKLDPDNGWKGWTAQIEFSAPGFHSRKVIATHRHGFRINETEMRPVTSWAHLMVTL
jgi:hypothetical protein